MSIIGIVAVDDNWGIGKNNSIPWKCSDDMHFFRETTLDSIVVMGRKTYESIPKELDRRISVVVSKLHRGINVIEDINEIKNIQTPYSSPIYIIGGAEIYKLAAPLIDTWIITYIKGNYDCDTFFPIDEIGIGKFSTVAIVANNAQLIRTIYTRNN